MNKETKIEKNINTKNKSEKCVRKCHKQKRNKEGMKKK